MDQFIKLTGLTTYTFWVKDFKFEVAAIDEYAAFQVANAELWDRLEACAVPGKFFQWTDHQHVPNNFIWVAYPL